jgi:hypothetical protein
VLDLRRLALQRAIEVASRMARWCEFPSLLSAVSGQGRIRISSPLSVCERCQRHFEAVCAPCELMAMEKRAAQREAGIAPVRWIRAAGGGR